MCVRKCRSTELYSSTPVCVFNGSESDALALHVLHVHILVRIYCDSAYSSVLKHSAHFLAYTRTTRTRTESTVLYSFLSDAFMKLQC